MKTNISQNEILAWHLNLTLTYVIFRLICYLEATSTTRRLKVKNNAFETFDLRIKVVSTKFFRSLKA
jgi:hypothetical protein